MTIDPKQAERRAYSWLLEWIPSRYRDNDVDKLPDPAGAKLVFEFDPQGCDPSFSFGLYIYGETGTGKTRSIVRLLRRLVLEHAGDYVFMRAQTFAEEVVERTRPGGEGGFSEWIAGLREAEILALDDIDKIHLTPRVAAELFELIEYRTAEDFATLFTAQCSLDRLGAKFSKKAKEEAAGIIRRIRETCKPVHFKLSNEQP